jgi:hypothetical protein
VEERLRSWQEKVSSESDMEDSSLQLRRRQLEEEKESEEISCPKIDLGKIDLIDQDDAFSQKGVSKTCKVLVGE